MEILDPYIGIIVICLVIIFSYSFDLLSKYTNIPSVLLLIGLGILIGQGLKAMNIETGEYLIRILEIVGIVGLIMIVLEATLELEIKKGNSSVIIKSFLVALFGLIMTSFLTGILIYYFIVSDIFVASIYAIPLSIMSSAIIIPSISGLLKAKKEFLVYESAFSDILGIMLFYLILSNAETPSSGGIVFNVSVNILGTLILAVLISYFLVWLLQRIKSPVKLFLLISVLVMLYAIAKIFHFSSLIIILIFGLILNNHRIFFTGKLHSWISEKNLEPVLKDFQLVTMESTFVVRTFFFVIFGVSLRLEDLLNPEDAIISLGIVGSILLIRYICLKLSKMKQIIPALFIAPRGLITILLFFAIPVTYQFKDFSPGILLYTILITNVIMALALVLKGKEKVRYSVLNFDDWDELDSEIAEAKRNRPQE